MQPQPFYLANRPIRTTRTLDVKNKYSQEVIAQVSLAAEADFAAALEAGTHAAASMKEMSAFERKAVLLHVAKKLQERSEIFAQTLSQETGKAIVHARLEVLRAYDTFTLAAEESTRIYGEVESLDISPAGKNLEAITKRFPVGLCGFIIPFNFPLNLAAHKIAPALAVGNPFIAKPASATPLSLLLLGEILAETSLPQGAFSLLPATAATAEVLATDPRVKHLSFTGSSEVGWRLKTLASRKTVTLELGGNAACIVDAGTDLTHVVKRLTFGAFFQAGQSCISVQRVFVHKSLFDDLQQKLIAAAKELVMGDPSREDTFVGPMISESECQRLEAWVTEAKKAGATVLCGGTAKYPFFPPTWLSHVPRTEKVVQEEAFGPIAVLESFDHFSEAVARANDSRFGLQLGVFTPLLEHALYAHDHAEVGGVVINDVPSVRIDSMAYGGIKDSGQGREGVRHAMREMTDLKTLIVRKNG